MEMAVNAVAVGVKGYFCLDSSEPLLLVGVGTCKHLLYIPCAGLGKPNAHSRAAEKNPAEGFSRHLSWAVDVPG